jgi:hypothetical protein
VISGLSGGLGNQMFQYAAGRALSIRLDIPLALDISWFEGRRDRQYALSPYRIEARRLLNFPWLTQDARGFVSRISRRWSPRLYKVPVFREAHFHYMNDFLSIEAPVFLEGYWQSNLYFEDMRSVLLKDFSLKECLPKNCEEFEEDIKDHDSICVHVRRGDYLTNYKASKFHGTCTLEYYYDGIAEICKGLVRPKCFIFSDDPEWVKFSFKTNIPMKVVDVNGPNEAHLDLALMSACNHFVIANSSLSWWAGWLSTRNSKRVIAPKKWFLNSKIDTSDLLPPDWKRR